jgi:hypothetical protein
MSRISTDPTTGAVAHWRTCEECEGEEQVEVRSCAHVGADCPCSGIMAQCSTCRGEGEVPDEDCLCLECDEKFRAWEAKHCKCGQTLASVLRCTFHADTAADEARERRMDR